LRSNRFWVIFLGVAVLISAAVIFLQEREPGLAAYVYSDGSLTKTIDLPHGGFEYKLHSSVSGGFNIITVEQGRIRVSDADCPDGICVSQGWISDGTLPIVCLPNRLVIRIGGGEALQPLDGVTR